MKIGEIKSGTWLLHTEVEGLKICEEMGFSEFCGDYNWGSTPACVIVGDRDACFFLHDLLKEYGIKAVVTRKY